MIDNEQFGQAPTLRDQSAMAALTGLLAKDDWKDADAGHCWDIADAMLTEREKGSEQ